jgi:hypothetical protein
MRWLLCFLGKVTGKVTPLTRAKQNAEEDEEDDEVEVAEPTSMQLDVEALKEKSVRLIAKLWDSAQV